MKKWKIKESEVTAQEMLMRRKGLRKPDHMPIISAYAHWHGGSDTMNINQVLTCSVWQLLCHCIPHTERKYLFPALRCWFFEQKFIRKNVQRALYAIINVFNWRDFGHTCFQILLTFSDWILRDCRWSKKLSFPYVSYCLSTQTLHTCNRQRKFNSFMQWKWWGVFFEIFETEQQSLVVQEPEFWSEKQLGNKTTFQNFNHVMLLLL